MSDLPRDRCQIAPPDLISESRYFFDPVLAATVSAAQPRPCSRLLRLDAVRAPGARSHLLNVWGASVSILENIFSRFESIAGRVKHDVTSAFQTKSAIDYTLAAVYTERTGKLVNYSVWFSHDAIEALDRTPEPRETHFVDETSIEELMDGKWVRRTCESKQDAIRFERHLKDGCYLSLITLLSAICK